MAKYYYNGVLLPEMPADVLAENPYVWIRKNTTSGNYDLCFAPEPWYINGNMYFPNIGSVTSYRYTVLISAAEETSEWTYENSGTFSSYTVDSSRTVMWSNHDIPNGSATATDIYFRGSRPTLTPIQLTNQWNSSIANDIAELTMELSGCTPGNMLILAYAVRGADNVVTLSDGWTVLGGGNNISTPESSYQYVLFAYKMAESAAETVTISQTEGKRIYAVCSEYFGVAGVKLRSDLAAIGTTNYTVTGKKTKAEDIMLYAVTSAYYGSGRNQTVTPTDIDKIEGDPSAERLACWFDGGLGATSHIFQTYNSTEARDAVLECVQLVLYDTKYLIRSNSTLYTVSDGALTALAETETTASLFQTYGVDEIPDGALLVGLTDPEVLYWQDSTDELPTLSLTVKGTPPLPQMFTSEPMNLTHESISGIDYAAVEASEDVRFAISFDGGTTWKAFDGSAWFDTSDTVPGMLASTMNAITAEQWAEVVVLESYKVRFWLPNVTAYVKSVVIHYINP